MSRESKKGYAHKHLLPASQVKSLDKKLGHFTKFSGGRNISRNVYKQMGGFTRKK